MLTINLYCVCFLVLHRVCVLDMYISLCYCASLNACSDDLLLCYVIIVVIFMTVLVYDQVAHMFHIMFTWSQFTCYIILVLLLLVLPWGSNVFCASVSGYKYICSKCITAYHHFEREKLYTLLVYSQVYCSLYPCAVVSV